ncbi:response regulator [Chitinasiproducens palmae]|uniref:Response regulator receiver domain-containing protein n=1 Tax=Chitinasiproducens palmae TaxID=1770053 RepID=A0A1H2PP28_9BURK|nr:response regulator transcription factor [Chitinasiproducens palmae]SDV48450.1 Response regulator receiver domain-containing protein [Chitinasiproducens palmae]
MPNTTLRLFVAEDSPLIRQRLRALLGSVEGLTFVGEADTSAGAVAGIAESRADVAIVDLGLREGNGLAVLRGMQGGPAVAIVLSNHVSAPIRRQCLAAGAAYVFDKSNEFTLLPATLRALADARGTAAH